MAIIVECPSCKKRYEVSEKLAGRKAKCSVCQSVLSIPTLPPAAEVDWDRVVAGAAAAPGRPGQVRAKPHAKPAPCPNCNSPLPEGAVLCVSCGYSLTAGMCLVTVVEREGANDALRAKEANGDSRYSPNGSGSRRSLGDFLAVLCGLVIWTMIGGLPGLLLGAFVTFLIRPLRR